MNPSHTTEPKRKLSNNQFAVPEMPAPRRHKPAPKVEKVQEQPSLAGHEIVVSTPLQRRVSDSDIIPFRAGRNYNRQIILPDGSIDLNQIASLLENQRNKITLNITTNTHNHYHPGTGAPAPVTQPDIIPIEKIRVKSIKERCRDCILGFFHPALVLTFATGGFIAISNYSELSFIKQPIKMLIEAKILQENYHVFHTESMFPAFIYIIAWMLFCLAILSSLCVCCRGALRGLGLKES